MSKRLSVGGGENHPAVSGKGVFFSKKKHGWVFGGCGVLCLK